MFNSKINIERPTGAQDDYGAPTPSFASHLTDVACRISWKKGQAVVINDRMVHARDARVRCAVLDITTEDRVVYNSQYYDIIDASKPGETHRFMTLDLRVNTEQTP